MQRINIEQDIRLLSELGEDAAALLKQVHETKRPLVITQHGKGVGVLLDVREYEAMQEKIEVLQNIHTSLGQLNEGKGIDHKEAKARVLSRIANQ